MAQKPLLHIPLRITMIQSYFSPGNDILDAITEQLQQCTNSLDICVFTLSDDRILDAIIACYRDGITIRVLSDNDKQYDRGSDIRTLSDAGVDVRVDVSDAHMHHKFMVVDEQIVVTGSYNWTRSAATRNAENIVIIDDQSTAESFLEEYERLWLEARPA